MNNDTHPLAEAWGAEIKRGRRELGMTRAELADHVGVTRQMVRLWEEGINAPGSKMQAHLAQRLSIDPVAVAKLMRQAMSGGDGPAAA